MSDRGRIFLVNASRLRYATFALGGVKKGDRMIRVLGFVALGLSVFATQSNAEGRTQIGYGRLIQNDFIGDGQDRWRTGSVASSRVWGPEGQVGLPQFFGELLEFRINAEIIAPDNLVTPAAGDRPYAGSLSFGLHTHYERSNIEYAVGLDMVLTGEMTLLGDFQGALHDLLGVDKASDSTLASQIDNAVHPTAVIEVGRTFSIGEQVELRPFVEARAGVETMLRAGADISFGRVGSDELQVRDPVSGQRYRVIQNPEEGFSFVVGGDIAKVRDSAYLPEADGYTVTDTRSRLRAGVHWQGETTNIFYGVTWLGEEFEGQDEGQVVGSLRLNLNF